MKNVLGTNLTVTLFGESHGPYIGAVLDGLAPGIPVDESFIQNQLSLRRPAGKISTARVEKDEFILASGVFNGRTTGTPLCILIPNTVQHSKDYEKTAMLARPGHADYTAQMKYHGFQDYRGGGHFSGRITAALVAAAAIVIPELSKKGITIGTHIKNLGGIEDRDFSEYTNCCEKSGQAEGKSGSAEKTSGSACNASSNPLVQELKELNSKAFAVLDSSKAAEMLALAEKIASEGDSVGGVLETAVTGLPAGVGEPWFGTLESQLSYGLYSIPAIKGVQFGSGFDMVCSRGSEFNDPFAMSGDAVITRTNHNGGINGGISNGMPVLFRCAVKPTPSIYKEQDTIDMKGKKDAKLVIEGRHDPAIIHRARVVVDSVTALVLYDILSGRYGTDYFGNEG